MKASVFVKFFSVAIAPVLLLLAGCSEDSSSNEPQAMQIIMGTSADMPPFEFYDAGEIVGYDIDVAKAVAGELGLDLQVRDMDFSALIPALQSGRVQFVMSSMTPTPERLKVVDFSEPYLSLPLAAITVSSDPISTEEGLSGKKIGVQLGSTHEQFAREVAGRDNTVKIHSLNKLAELIQELKTGRIDVVIMETKTAKSFQDMTPDLTVSAIHGNSVSFAIAFPKGSDWQKKFNEAIQKLQASGRFEELKTRWFSDFKTKSKA